jgi:hypothetical protein
MARLFFAAHDSGGANLLAPVARRCAAAGHVVRICAEGPARRVWPDAETMVDPEAALGAFGADIAVTGTSEFADLEHRIWRVARTLGVTSLAAIDAWMNLRQRFRPGPGGDAGQPDALCVIDAAMYRELRAPGWCEARLHIAGQPHLEYVADEVRQRRIGKSESMRTVSFFSEPITGVGAAERIGYQQFQVAALIAEALGPHGPLHFIVQPHPKEPSAPWRAWLRETVFPASIEVALSTIDTESLLVESAVATSMASMVAIEAALTGMPVLAVQPHRRYCPNPAIDAMAEVLLVTDPSKLPAAAAALMAHPGRNAANKRFTGSTERFLKVITHELERTDKCRDIAS